MDDLNTEPEPKYILEIYRPGSVQETGATLFSLTPFGAIGRGDIVHPFIFDNGEACPRAALVVTRVEHMLWRSSSLPMGHKICVYTREAPNTPELRTQF